MPSFAIGLFTASIFVLCLGSMQSIGFARDIATTRPVPTPQLSPKDVVSTVVKALRENDATDSGIKTTWGFASPANQKATGPLQKFIPLVKNAAYGTLLNHQSAEVREIAVKDDKAAELAIVTDANGAKSYFVFQLSKQTDGDLKDYWMTDGVVRVQPPDANPPANPAPKLPDGQSPA